MTRRIPVFFYGSFINLDVLKKSGLEPEKVAVAILAGWDLRIEPLATLIPAEERVTYGIVAACSHEELEKLYAQDWVGNYLPEPVLVEHVVASEDDSDPIRGGQVPALTYIKWEYQPAPAAADYVERIAGPAEAMRFPRWYVERIRSFAPSG